MAANEGLSGSHPDDVGIRRRDPDRTNRSDRLIVEERPPVNPAIARFPEPAGGGAGVIGARIARNSRHRRNPIPFGADIAVLELREEGRIGLGSGRSTLGRSRADQCAKGEETRQYVTLHREELRWGYHEKGAPQRYGPPLPPESRA